MAAIRAYAAEREAVRLSPSAFGFACDLIKQGHFVPDKKGGWASNHPSRSQENELIRKRGFAEYSRWYLAIDERHASDGKARYKFPFGDFQRIHRCGLLAIKARAREYGYRDIERAAEQLLQMIESAGPRAKKRVD